MRDTIVPGQPNFNDFEAFTQSLKIVSSIGVDLPILEKKNDYQKISEYDVDEDFFYDHIYVHRRQQNEILSYFLDRRDLIILIGPQRSGKTCILRKVMREVKQRKRLGYYCCLIDSRKSITTIDAKEDPVAFEKEFATHIVSRYLAELFPIPTTREKKERTNILHLCEYILSPNNDLNLTIFGDLIRKAPFTDIWKHKKYIDSNEGKNFLDWLKDNFNHDLKIHKLIDYVKSNITISQIMHAASAIYEFRNQLLLIDNIDLLPEKHQTHVTDVCTIIHNRTADVSTIVLAMRDENVYQPFDYEERGAPPFETTIHLYPSKKSQNALRLGDISREEFENIVSKRFEWARTLQEREIARLESAIKHAKKDIKDHDLRELEISDLKSRLDNKGIPLSNDAFVECLALKKKILNVFEKFDAISLANGSLNSLLNILADFLAYLIDLPDLEGTKHGHILPANQYHQGLVDTLFLVWLRESELHETISTYDIVHASEASYLDSDEIGFSLEHLIVTTTWNLTHHNNRSSKNKYIAPTVGQVLDEICSLGFEKNRILLDMFSLHENADRHCGIIELQDRETNILDNFNKLTEDDLIYVTPRGKSLIANLSNTFGYFYGCCQKNELFYPNFMLPPQVNETKTLEQIFPVLCDIAQSHILFFFNVYKKINRPNWQQVYRSKFGIPMSPHYARHSLQTVGVKIGQGYYKALQFEALIDGIKGYVFSSNNKETRNLFTPKLNELIKVFKNYVDNISNLENDISFSIRKDLNIPARKGG
ncbi:MAG: hypothetical protein AAF490_22890 [Chloroflexota bacterium]